MKRLAMFIAVMSVVLLGMSLVTGCGKSTSIKDILDNPSDYAGKEVSVEGTVGETNWFQLLTKGTFQVGDGSGTIWVVTDQPPPQEGAKVTLKGTVESAGIKIGDRTFGTVIVETSRD